MKHSPFQRKRGRPGPACRVCTPFFMKIDPYNFPILIIVAFVIGMVLAMLLGFRPQHGSTEQSLLLLLAQSAQLGSWLV